MSIFLPIQMLRVDYRLAKFVNLVNKLRYYSARLVTICLLHRLQQSLPRLRFNKEGNLLAVTTADNGFKILANAVGLRSLRATEAPPFEALRGPIDPAVIKVTNFLKLADFPENCLMF